MKPCFNGTLSKAKTLIEYLDAARAAGFQTIEGDIESAARLAQEHGRNYVRNLYTERGITLGAFGLPVDTSGDEQKFKDGLAQLPEYAELALVLGGTRCCTWLWPSIDELPVPYASRLAKRFRACAEVLSAYGIGLGLEFVGPHHLRNRRYPFVYTMDQLFDYIAGIGADNVGVLLDSYHWYTTEATVHDIRKLSVNQVVHVHVNDTNQVPAQAIDNDRLLPGEGRIDLLAFCTALHDIGYSGPLAIEVLRPEPFIEPELDVATRARAGLERVLSQLPTLV